MLIVPPADSNHTICSCRWPAALCRCRAAIHAISIYSRGFFTNSVMLYNTAGAAACECGDCEATWAATANSTPPQIRSYAAVAYSPQSATRVLHNGVVKECLIYNSLAWGGDWGWAALFEHISLSLGQDMHRRRVTGARGARPPQSIWSIMNFSQCNDYTWDNIPVFFHEIFLFHIPFKMSKYSRIF